MKHCAVVELFGVRELAEDDVSVYQAKTHALLNAIREINASSEEHVKAWYLGNKCYAEFVNEVAAIQWLKALRAYLLDREELFIKGAVAQGELKAHPVNYSDGAGTVDGTRFGPLAAELDAVQDRVKAIALVWHSRNLDAPPKGPMSLQKNYYASDDRIAIYRSFMEVPLDQDTTTSENLKKVMRVFRKARVASKKAARFFAPLLLNWARNMDWSTPLDPTETSLDAEAARGKLGGFRDIPGMELVFLKLMDVVYGQPPVTAIEDERASQLKARLRASKWIHRYVARDGQGQAAVPIGLLSPVSRRRFADDLHHD